MTIARKLLPLAVAFALGVGLSLSLSSHADIAPRPVKKIKKVIQERPVVVKSAEVGKQVAPTGKADVRVLATGKEAFMGLLRMDAGAQVPMHRDKDEEYIYILEGEGTMTIDFIEYEVGPGTAIYMPKNAQVKFANGDREMVALQVFAGPDSAKKYDKWKVSLVE